MTRNLHLSQKLLKQHLLVNTASFITSLHNGQWSSGGRSPMERVEGKPSISFSKAALYTIEKIPMIPQVCTQEAQINNKSIN